VEKCYAKKKPPMCQLRRKVEDKSDQKGRCKNGELCLYAHENLAVLVKITANSIKIGFKIFPNAASYGAHILQEIIYAIEPATRQHGDTESCWLHYHYFRLVNE
jgi:hypothetical protein